MDIETPQQTWWANGLLFEGCNCQIVCPGHFHFQQLCTHERCRGFWALEFRDGRVEHAEMAGVRAVIAYDAPQRMVDGGWTQSLVVDAAASAQQAAACERLVSGALGGPWAVLARFVTERVPMRRAPIEMTHAPLRHEVSAAGIMQALVGAIRGRSRDEPVRLENIFNQIHASTQIVGRSEAHYDDGVIRFESSGTHGLWSRFEWRP